MSVYDVLFIGSSPNALAGAARLALAGRRVLVLETREVVGGPVATEELAPGLRVDAGLMSAAIDPAIAQELGLSIDVIRRVGVTSLLEGGSQTLVELPVFPRAIQEGVELVRALDRMASFREGSSLEALGRGLLDLGEREMHEVLRLVLSSARDVFEEHIESEPARALLAGIAVRGLSEGPFAPSSLYGFLRHVAAGEAMIRSSAKGGLLAMAEAMADKARGAGAEIRLGVRGAVRVAVESGVARGALVSGERIAADAVVSDYDARFTFTNLVSPAELDPETNRSIRSIRLGGSVARVHLGLEGLPRFKVDPDALRGTLVLAPSVAAIERAWDEGKRGVSTAPYIEATVPTIADPSLAPEGQHVLDAWVQYVPYGRGDRRAVARSVIDRLTPFAPGLTGQVLHERVSLPEDLEARYGLTEGHLYGGDLRLQQAFFLRSIPGCSGGETPIQNLYLGGSAVHPGGYSGRSGWSVAGHLLERAR